MTVRRSPGGPCKLPTRPPLQVGNGGRADELKFPLENLSMCQLSSMNTASFLNNAGCCAAVRGKLTVVPGIRGHSSSSHIAGERNLTWRTEPHLGLVHLPSVPLLDGSVHCAVRGRRPPRWGEVLDPGRRRGRGKCDAFVGRVMVAGGQVDSRRAKGAFRVLFTASGRGVPLEHGVSAPRHASETAFSAQSGAAPRGADGGAGKIDGDAE